MRLDLFLKSSRLIKRRAIAREMCNSGRVLVNEREAKPGKEVKPGDSISIHFMSRLITLVILTLPDRPSRSVAAETLYRITSDMRTRDSDRGE